MKKVFFIFRDRKSYMLADRLGVDCFCIFEGNNSNPIFQLLIATVFVFKCVWGYGLQRAFLVAGARTIIMSLFKVSDEATQKLMVKFYAKWLETGDKRASFIAAKQEIKDEYKDLIYWWAFIMIGLD